MCIQGSGNFSDKSHRSMIIGQMCVFLNFFYCFFIFYFFFLNGKHKKNSQNEFLNANMNANMNNKNNVWLFLSTERERFNINTYGFRYWNATHFTVHGAVKEVNSENVTLVRWIPLSPIFSRVTTRKMAVALPIIAVYLHIIPQSNANE